MKITYTPNPLRTQVLLDDHDKEVFRLKLKIAELDSRLFDVHFHLSEPEATYYSVEKARKAADPDYYMQDTEEKTPLDLRVDMLFEHYLEALQDTHVGDCTCTACSCRKCRAEDILGINTLDPSPGSPALSAINGAFGKDRTLAEALAYLKTPISREKPENWRNATQEEYESYIPKWEDSRATAFVYLENYARTHFTDQYPTQNRVASE